MSTLSLAMKFIDNGVSKRRCQWTSSQVKSGQRAGDFVVIWKSDYQSTLQTVKSDPYAPLPADLDYLLWLHWSTRAEKQSAICDDGITGSHEHLRATFRVISTANTELISEKQSAQSRTTSVFYSLFSDFRFAKKKKKENKLKIAFEETPLSLSKGTSN